MSLPGVDQGASFPFAYQCKTPNHPSASDARRLELQMFVSIQVQRDESVLTVSRSGVEYVEPEIKVLYSCIIHGNDTYLNPVIPYISSAPPAL